ncbi:MAG: hypothetical protein EA420_05680 [Candidatus Competibacteraceae bacterium]|nr:MAG: hypothetical protein EA420_05680 [Candidatus Competibacteraceae bacterium]
MKTTRYFDATRGRPDRVRIEDEWILRAMERPDHEHVQGDGRVRRWVRIQEAGNRYLRVVLLPDRETVHNAFFDRGFRP